MKLIGAGLGPLGPCWCRNSLPHAQVFHCLTAPAGLFSLTFTSVSISKYVCVGFFCFFFFFHDTYGVRELNYFNWCVCLVQPLVNPGSG